MTNAGSVTVGASKIDNSGVQAGTIKLDATTGKITGVADGEVSASSKEVVNGSQLHATNTNVTNLTTTVNKGINFGGTTGSNKYALGDTINVFGDSNITSTTTAGGAQLGLANSITIGDAATGKPVTINGNNGTIGGLTNTTWNGTATKGQAATEDQLKNIADNAAAATAAAKTEVKAGSTNVTVTEDTTSADGHSIYTVDVAKDLNLTSITAGNTVLNTGGVSITGGTNGTVSLTNAGLNNGGNKITNVANGTDATDVVNVSQLNAAAAAASNSVSNKDGNLTVNGTPNANGSTDYSVGLADNITIGSGTNAVNIDGTTGEISVGDTTINGDGISISGGPSVTKNGIDAAGNKVTNVADGNIAAGSKDAVNGGQIADLVSNINTDIANAAAASKTEVKAGSTNVTVVNGTDATDGHSTYTVDVAKDLKIDSVNTGGTVINDKGLSFVDDQGNAVANSPSISSSGINAGNQKITGVVNGVVNDTSTDAVNGSQLNTTNQYIASSLGGGAGYDNITGSFTHPTYNVNGGSHNNVGDALTALDDRDNQLDNKITNLGDQLQQAFYTTSERINDVEKRANAGIAAAMALETAPYVAGKWTYAAATAYHGGENAVGVTFRKTADNGRWSLTSGVAAASQGDPSFRIGISGVID